MAIRTSASKSGAWESKTAFADDRPPVRFDLKRGLEDNLWEEREGKREAGKRHPSGKGGEMQGGSRWGSGVGRLMTGGQIIFYLSARLQWGSTESQIGN